MPSPKKKKRAKLSSPRADVRILLPVWYYLGLLVIISALPHISARMWGIDTGSWLPVYVWLTALALPFLLLLPSLGSRAAALNFDAEGKQAGAWRRRSLLPFIFFAGLLASVFLVKTAYPFLGDGVFYRTEVFRLLHDPDRVSALIKPTSVLTGTVIEWIADVLKPEQTDTPYFVVCVISLLLLLFLSSFLLRRTAPAYRMLLLSPVLLTAGVLLYYTYIELYVLQYTFGALFCISVFTWQRGRHGPLLPALLLLLSMGFGISSVIFIPSLATLILLSLRPQLLRGPRSRAAVLIVLTAAGIGSVLLLHALGDRAWLGQFLMPFTSPATDPLVDRQYFTYTVFSSAHLIDIVNVLLLHTGPLLLILVSMRKRPGWRALLEDNVAFVLLVAGLGGALQLLFGASTFALARDWDLMLLPTLAWSFLAIRGILLLPSHAERGLLATAAMAAMAATAVLWVTLNAIPASADRFERILDADREWVGVLWLREGYRTLEQYHVLAHNDAAADRVLTKMLDLGYNKLDTYESRFLHVLEMEDKEAAMRSALQLMDAMARDTAPDMPRESWKHVSASALHSKLASIIIETASSMGQEQLVSAALQRYAPILPDWREAGLLRALVSRDLPPDARYAMVKDVAFTEESDPLLYPYRANLAQLAGLCDTAVYYFEAMIARDIHAYPRAYIGLAQVHLGCTRDTLAAIRSLERLQKNCLLAEERQYANQLLQQLKTRG